MGDRLPSVGAFVFVLLLVSTAATTGVVPGASPVGDATAEWVDCSFGDSLIGAAYNTLTGADTDCRWDAGDSIDYENMSNTDGYASLTGVADNTDSYVTTTTNFMQDGRTVAMSKAKITMIQELNNGTSASATKVTVNETVSDYYTRIQMNVFEDWNAKMVQVEYVENSTSLNYNLYRYAVAPDYRDNKVPIGFVTDTVTLHNGTTMNVTRILDEADGTRTYGPYDNGNTSYHFELRVEDPNNAGTWTTIVNATNYGREWSGPALTDGGIPMDANQQASQVKSNMAPYIDTVYAQYAVGEINSTDLALNDPTVIAQEASTDFTSTGYYGSAAIMLASLGAGGDINTSHTIVTGDGTTLNGTLYYVGDDSTGWDTGTQYNFSDYNGTFYMAVQKDDGSGTVADLSNYGSNFTITEATNTQTGEAVNTTNPQRYTYDTYNASNLQEELDQLAQLRQEYEDSLSGGGSSGSGLSTRTMGILILAGAAAVLLIQREGQ